MSQHLGNSFFKSKPYHLFQLKPYQLKIDKVIQRHDHSKDQTEPHPRSALAGQLWFFPKDRFRLAIYWVRLTR